MGALAVPIIPGKLDAWKAWSAELTGPRRAAFEDLNARHGLTRHRAYLQQNPDGSHLVIAVHDGPGGDGFMAAIARSDHEFDREFVARITEFHPIDISQPPPLPDLVIDGGGA